MLQGFVVVVQYFGELDQLLQKVLHIPALDGDLARLQLNRRRQIRDAYPIQAFLKLSGERDHGPALALTLIRPALYASCPRYANPKDCGEAAAHLEQACWIWESVFGPSHPDTLSGLKQLGVLRLRQGQLSQAEALIGRYLSESKEAGRKALFESALARISLAEVQAQQDRRAEADALLQRAIADVEEVCKAADESTLAGSLQSISSVYFDMGEYAKAEELMQRAFAIFENALGPENPQTVKSFKNLATAYQHANQFDPVPADGRRFLIIPTLNGERFVMIHGAEGPSSVP